MQYNQLNNSDLKVSEICLGTMTFGQQNTIAQAHEQLDYAIAQGINFIDAVEMYPVPPQAATYGVTETYIGEWLKKQQRDRVIVERFHISPATLALAFVRSRWFVKSTIIGATTTSNPKIMDCC